MKPLDPMTIALSHEARIASLESKIKALEKKIERARKVSAITGEEHAARIRIGQITAEVATRYGVTVERMRSHDKRHVFNAPRWEAWALCQDERFSTPVIGRYFGGRDHTTILHGIRQHRGKTKAPE